MNEKIPQKPKSPEKIKITPRSIEEAVQTGNTELEPILDSNGNPLRGQLLENAWVKKIKGTEGVSPNKTEAVIAQGQNASPESNQDASTSNKEVTMDQMLQKQRDSKKDSNKEFTKAEQVKEQKRTEEQIKSDTEKIGNPDKPGWLRRVGRGMGNIGKEIGKKLAFSGYREARKNHKEMMGDISRDSVMLEQLLEARGSTFSNKEQYKEAKADFEQGVTGYVKKHFDANGIKKFEENFKKIGPGKEHMPTYQAYQASQEAFKQKRKELSDFTKTLDKANPEHQEVRRRLAAALMENRTNRDVARNDVEKSMSPWKRKGQIEMGRQVAGSLATYAGLGGAALGLGGVALGAPGLAMTAKAGASSALTGIFGARALTDYISHSNTRVREADKREVVRNSAGEFVEGKSINTATWNPAKIILGGLGRTFSSARLGEKGGDNVSRRLTEQDIQQKIDYITVQGKKDGKTPEQIQAALQAEKTRVSDLRDMWNKRDLEFKAKARSNIVGYLLSGEVAAHHVTGGASTAWQVNQLGQGWQSVSQSGIGRSVSNMAGGIWNSLSNPFQQSVIDNPNCCPCVCDATGLTQEQLQPAVDAPMESIAESTIEVTPKNWNYELPGRLDEEEINRLCEEMDRQIGTGDHHPEEFTTNQGVPETWDPSETGDYKNIPHEQIGTGDHHPDTFTPQASDEGGLDGALGQPIGNETAPINPSSLESALGNPLSINVQPEISRYELLINQEYGKLGLVDVEKGDIAKCLLAELFQKMPNLSHLSDQQVENILRNLNDITLPQNSGLAQELGFGSGNIDDIYPGEQLNVQKIYDLITTKDITVGGVTYDSLLDRAVALDPSNTPVISEEMLNSVVTPEVASSNVENLAAVAEETGLDAVLGPAVGDTVYETAGLNVTAEQAASLESATARTAEVNSDPIVSPQNTTPDSILRGSRYDLGAEQQVAGLGNVVAGEMFPVTTANASLRESLVIANQQLDSVANMNPEVRKQIIATMERIQDPSLGIDSIQIVSDGASFEFVTKSGETTKLVEVLADGSMGRDTLGGAVKKDGLFKRFANFVAGNSSTRNT